MGLDRRQYDLGVLHDRCPQLLGRRRAGAKPDAGERNQWTKMSDAEAPGQAVLRILPSVLGKGGRKVSNRYNPQPVVKTALARASADSGIRPARRASFGTLADQRLSASSCS